MNNRHGAVSRMFSYAAILAIGASFATFSGADGSGDAWSVGMTARGAAPLVLAGASYEVEVLGSVAVGTLVQEFVNGTEGTVVAVYESRPPLGLRVVRARAESDGASLVDLPAAPARVDRRAARKDRTTRGTAPSSSPGHSFSVEPGETVTVRSSFQTSMALREGRFVLRLPPVQSANAGSGAGEVSGNVVVTVRDETRLLRAASPSHEIDVSYRGMGARIDLIGSAGIGRRAFELELEVGDDSAPSLLGFVGAGDDEQREVLVVLTPPVVPDDASVRPKQVLIVLDTSGSMGRGKLDIARAALYSCLEKLAPFDRYNIVEFNGQFTTFRPEPVDVEDVSPQTAGVWLDSLRAKGGTRLEPALLKTFLQPDDPDRHRMVILLTDGAVQDFDRSNQLMEEKLGVARLFVVGIGQDVREENIRRLTDLGRGVAAFARDPEALEAAVLQLFDSVSAPLAWDLEIDWGGADAEVIGPARLPDLYAGRPVTVFARVNGPLPSEVVVHGQTTDGVRAFTAMLAEPSTDEGTSLLPRPESEGSPQTGDARSRPRR